mgnify:CR=1 FL=1
MAKIVDSLSIQQARKLVLLSQKVIPSKQSGSAIAATLSAIEHLGYIQIDTISAIQRAHHHTLWNRNPRYDSTHLDQLVSEKQVFEYWSHAAAYLPMKDYRFTLPRKQAIASGKEKHWYLRDERLMKSIVNRIASEGPLMAKDFEFLGNKSKNWSSQPVKQALGNLFMEGDLMISSRRNFHKVYDLTENVLPYDLDCSMPSQEEYIRFLITRFLQANGLGQVSEITYLLKNIKSKVSATIQDMVLSGELLQVNVGGGSYYTLPSSIKLLKKPLAHSKLKILSPFDNLIIQRKRIQSIFGFDYQLECYVPEAKRKFGYFVLPILWNRKLVARMDCKVDRKTSVLHLHKLVLEPDLNKNEAFADALVKELVPFLEFQDCDKLYIHNTFPAEFKPLLEKLVCNLMKA